MQVYRFNSDSIGWMPEITLVVPPPAEATSAANSSFTIYAYFSTVNLGGGAVPTVGVEVVGAEECFGGFFVWKKPWGGLFRSLGI